jgi:two-component system, sensor histidine kinase YesM
VAGFVRIGIPSSILEGILDKARFSGMSAALLLDSQGDIVASAGPVAEAARRHFPSLRPMGGTEASVPAPEALKDVSLQAFALLIRDTDWRLVLLVPSAVIDAFGQKAQWSLLLVLLVIAPLMLPLAYWTASRSTARLARLAKGVREFEIGNLELRLPAEGKDEIGELARELNRMASRISSLMDERYRLGLEVKNLELTALQAQINPHFLYNTLDLMNCLALHYNAPRIGEAAGALSRFYRLALSAGAETVAIEQELEHVATYVRIQNMRFEGAIELAIDVPPRIGGIRMLKIVLQPLAENSILHGILEKPEGRGRIAIRARFEEESAVLIEVEDDGVGMSPERMARMFEGGGESPEARGYCVRNVDRRLRLKYGEGFGLSYRSEEGRGTTATVRIPAN